MPERWTVPAEFVGGAETPEQAAAWLDDVMGLTASMMRAEHHRQLAETEGRSGEAAFYAEILEVLARWGAEIMKSDD